MKFVHISDIHFSNDFNPNSLEHKALLNDIKQFNSDENIDFVIISGDLVDKGGRDFDNRDLEFAYLSFEEKYINSLLTTINLPRQRLIFVPGNHDIQRNADDKHYESGLKNDLKNITSIDEFMSRPNKDFNGYRRIKIYKNFEKYFYCDSINTSTYIEILHSNFHYHFIINHGGKRIGVAGLNSAWRCFNDDDAGNLIIGKQQLSAITQRLQDCDLKICVMHHNTDFLVQDEQDEIENLIQNNFNILFIGHVHNGKTWTKTDVYGSLFTSIAPLMSPKDKRDSRKYANGYSIIDYDFDKGRILVYHRRISVDGKNYIPNNDLGDGNGYREFIVSRDSLKYFEQRKNIFDFYEKDYIPSLNKNLVSYDTTSNAPKDIDEIFVFPPLVCNQSYSTEKSDTFIKSMDELCNLSHHTIITGNKEAGKSLLLSKMLMEIVRNNNCNVVPILIDFQDIRTERITQNIAHAIDIPKKEVPSFLENNRVIILIDNLVDDNAKIKQLENLYTTYSTIIFVFTSRLYGNEDTPILLSKYDFLRKMKIMKISEFKSKHIRSLVTNWFPNESNKVIKSRSSLIVQMFSTLNLPRTPLALSIFLWIFEAQGNFKPINQAAMLENYIEKLLCKGNDRIILSGSFDYKNMESLLADIAHFMYYKNNTLYQVSENDLITFIVDYLKQRCFSYKAKEILDSILKSSILVSISDNNICFRFNCFFEYFLAKKMEIDNEFKNYVMNETNYLKFFDEIDYFTALKRNDSSTLKLLLSRLDTLFEKFHRIYAPNYDTFFSYGHTENSSLIENINKGFNKKPNEEELDDINDNLLSKNNESNQVQKKEEPAQELFKFDLLWTLTAKILKNTEEISNSETKKMAWKKLFSQECCSMFL